MYRLPVFALSAAALLGVSLTSAQAGWHRHYCAPVCTTPVVTCAPAACPAPVVSCTPAPCPAPVVNYYPGFRFGYYNSFGRCGPRYVHTRRWCR